MNPAIEVENLTKHYGPLQAVNALSFAVPRSEVFAFLGPNGAGKTTTVEIIETLRAPTSGRVSVLGMDIATHKREILPRIGVLPQGFSSFDRITVCETIHYYATLFNRQRTDINRLMALTSLHDHRNVQFKNLSGGLKQRLGIAIALVNDPEVVFLDEPTTGLDPHARRAVWDVLLGLKNQGKTVFLTTHYMEEAELLADTVAIIARGRLVALGSPAELIARHADFTSVTLSNVDAPTLEMIQQLGYAPVRVNCTGVKFPVKRSEDVQDILNALKIHRQGNQPLPGLDVRKPSLEEVFLELT